MQTDDLIREINGRTYKQNKYKPSKSLRILNLLGEIIGEPLGNAIGSFKGGETESSRLEDRLELDGEAFGRAVRLLFTNLGDVDPATLIEKILSNVEVRIQTGDKDGFEKFSLDRHFDGRLEDLVPVCAWVLRSNYENFLKSLATYAPKLEAVLDRANKTEKE